MLVEGTLTQPPFLNPSCEIIYGQCCPFGTIALSLVHVVYRNPLCECKAEGLLVQNRIFIYVICMAARMDFIYHLLGKRLFICFTGCEQRLSGLLCIGITCKHTSSVSSSVDSAFSRLIGHFGEKSENFLALSFFSFIPVSRSAFEAKISAL